MNKPITLKNPEVKKWISVNDKVIKGWYSNTTDTLLIIKKNKLNRYSIIRFRRENGKIDSWAMESNIKLDKFIIRIVKGSGYYTHVLDDYE